MNNGVAQNNNNSSTQNPNVANANVPNTTTVANTSNTVNAKVTTTSNNSNNQNTTKANGNLMSMAVPQGQVQLSQNTEQPEPVITQSVNVPETQIVNGQPIGIIPQESTEEKPVEAPKKKLNFTPILIFLILLLIGGIIFLIQKNKADVARFNFECSPVGYKEETKLDLNSTLVQNLYNKVKTNIREDLASTNFDNAMKLYLAFRQIPEDMIYESNCNLFSSTAMEPYTCPDMMSFTPMAFKEETIQLELRKLFGENVNVPNGNVQIGKDCVGGYQYIAERGEYVKGYCQKQSATIFRAEKKLTEAKSYGNYIILTEDVKYIGNDSAQVPEELVSGTYQYTFKLDTNYNYIYLSKEYVEKY